MKWLIRIVIGALVILFLGGVMLAFGVDAATKTVVEVGAGRALDVQTSLGKANVRILGGQVDLHELDVANPVGFNETPRFMRLGQASTDLSLMDLPRQRIELDRLTLDDIDVYLERKEGRSNYRVILDKLKEFQRAGDAEGGKELLIREVVLRDITVSVRLLPVGGEATRTEMTISEIKLENVGSGDDGVNTAQLVGVITTSLLAGIFKQGADILPDDMLRELGNGVAALGDLGQFGLTVAGESFEGAAQLIGNVAEGLGGAGENIIEGAGDAVRGIGELFRRKEDE